MNKIAYLTANIGQYDDVHEYNFKDKDIDYFYFTDGEKVPRGFKLIQVKDNWFPEGMLNVQKARLIKANPWKHIPNVEQYDYIVWTDSCFKQEKSIHPIINLMKGRSIITMKHPDRDCIYQEAETLIEFGIGDPKAIKRHCSSLRDLEYPEYNGLSATGIMIRKNNSDSRSVSNMWEICLSKDLYRDQLFFDYVCWVLKVTYSSFPYRDRNLFWYTHLHKGKRI